MHNPLSKSISASKLYQTLRHPRSKRNHKGSDVLDKRQPSLSLPDLPSELWILIIRAVTMIYPDPLDTTQAISFLESPNSQLRHVQYKESMRQKLHLALVNRFWHQYAQEFVYEFVWISKAAQAKALASALARHACETLGKQNGNYIRRLHIETSIMDRCDPADLRTILDYSPRLVVYSDYRSVRRNLAEESCNPRSSPAQLFSTLARPNNSLKRLSWTNYDDCSFHVHMSSKLESIAANLEFLELNFCSSHLHSMFSNTAPAQAPLDSIIQLSLPALRSLKVTLDNDTFSVLSAWDLPSLQNLSVLSADFSYAGPGFSKFFLIHGPKVQQLELGHSTSTIEEHYLTARPPNANQHHHIPLAAWCPNLREFICSADAEWNWENPDWIAPHILLPTHPGLEFIGIRDINKRLMDDIEFAAGTNPNIDENDDAPFFMLLQQIGSLLREEAFPSLRFIRDMDSGSDRMRRDRPERRVLRFWRRVLQRCKERNVWFEDCCGVNIRQKDLEKFEALAVSRTSVGSSHSE